MFEQTIKKELRAYTITERIVFYSTVIIALGIIFLSNTLYETSFGQASLAYGLTSLGIITLLRVLKVWGPKN